MWDARSRGWFTGDTFGFPTANGQRERPLRASTSSPVQFEPEELKASIARLLARDPQWMYLTHYGRVGDVGRLARDLYAQIDAMVATGAIAWPGGSASLLVEALRTLYLERAHVHAAHWMMRRGKGAGHDIELNAQGLASWAGSRQTLVAGGAGSDCGSDVSRDAGDRRQVSMQRFATYVVLRSGESRLLPDVGLLPIRLAHWQPRRNDGRWRCITHQRSRTNSMHFGQLLEPFHIARVVGLDVQMQREGCATFCPRCAVRRAVLNRRIDT